MDWPEITQDTPLEEIKRIHQQIWQYVVENGRKPCTPYRFDCAACEYVRNTHSKEYEVLNCFFDMCPIAWSGKFSTVHPCGKEYFYWRRAYLMEKDFNKATLLAEKIRDILFKYELEEKVKENSQNLS